MTPYRSSTIVALIDDAIEVDPRPRDTIAQEIGISGTMLSMIRTGATVLPSEHIEAVARVLNIPLAALVVAGIDSYPKNNAWHAMGVLMRIRLRDLVAAERAPTLVRARPKKVSLRESGLSVQAV